ncbi:hypothetical protein ACTMTF_13610 [Nonomuraea sp. ZG12]|uniref:hypothetical protein n=1 Tax=Nonomuraea sp. ZG12 TaxID=3452207 RepID=UPI003F8B2EA8
MSATKVSGLGILFLLAATFLPSSAYADPVGDGDVVTYRCEINEQVIPGDVRIRITLTMPSTTPRTGEQFSIGWTGEFVPGSELEAPAGVPAGLKMYAYASISKLPQLTSAMGVGELAAVTAGQPIALLESVNMTTTSKNPGTASVKPASVNFGLSPQNRLIDCEPTNSATLKTYPLTIGGTGSTTPTADEEETDEEPTPQESEDEPTTRSSQTPEEGVATGAGGEAGPDGRMLVLAGSALVLAAGAGGLTLRRTQLVKR